MNNIEEEIAVSLFDLLRIVIGIIAFLIIIFSSFRIVHQTERGLVERWGKFQRYANPGLTPIIPFVERVRLVNITEQMIDAEPQEIITDDNLNATVDAQVYFKVRDEEEGVKNCIYNVNNYRRQIVNLARTTLRNIIGTLSLKEANSERDRINAQLLETLTAETVKWGIDVVRTELKEIDPPKDVQDAMNQVVKAENEKIAAKDFANAEETKADGVKRAAIKDAEGKKQSRILEAEGEKEGLILEAEGDKQGRILSAEGKSKAIELENIAAEAYFVNNAQLFKSLETVAASLENNTKIVLPVGESLVNVVSDMANVTPIPLKESKKSKKSKKPDGRDDEDRGQRIIKL